MIPYIKKNSRRALVSLILGFYLVDFSSPVFADENLGKIAALQQGQISTIVERMDKSWRPCGFITDLANQCELPTYSLKEYEYGIAFNSVEPMSVVCVLWNRGFKIHNREPYMTYTDNPSVNGTMQWGGFMFYTKTNATDDDTCPGGGWRHRYWSLDEKAKVIVNGAGNGCFDKHQIYCRRR